MTVHGTDFMANEPTPFEKIGAHQDMMRLAFLVALVHAVRLDKLTDGTAHSCAVLGQS